MGIGRVDAFHPGTPFSGLDLGNGSLKMDVLWLQTEELTRTGDRCDEMNQARECVNNQTYHNHTLREHIYIVYATMCTFAAQLLQAVT